MSKEEKLLAGLEACAKGNEELTEQIREVAKLFRKKEKRLEKIVHLSDKQQHQLLHLNEELEKAYEELDQYRNRLEERVEEEVEKNRVKEKMLVEQSKLAAMGEMVDAVAHQWKQPLGIIDLKIQMIREDYKYEEVNEEYIEAFIDENRAQIRHLIETLNEFRGFLRPNRKIGRFPLAKTVESALLLMKDELMGKRIQCDLSGDRETEVEGNENEVKHIVLNLLGNARDAFEELGIEERRVTFRIYPEEHYLCMEAQDNAGGIPEKVINDIFKPHVTTKAEGKGTGIGLYMSTLITQKHGGELTVANQEGGACFTLKLPLPAD